MDLFDLYFKHIPLFEIFIIVFTELWFLNDELWFLLETKSSKIIKRVKLPTENHSLRISLRVRDYSENPFLRLSKLKYFLVEDIEAKL